MVCASSASFISSKIGFQRVQACHTVKHRLPVLGNIIVC